MALYLYWLSGEHVDIARAEAAALVGEAVFAKDRIALHENYIERCAYVRSVFKLLFWCDASDLDKALDAYGFGRVYKDSFSVTVLKEGKVSASLAKDLAKKVWHKLNNPKVKLKEAQLPLWFFFDQGKVFCCRWLFTNEEDFEARKAHKRKALHPSSMHPKLAKAMVNLTGIHRGKLYDPFCGAGGILIEAALLELKGVGYDIEAAQIARAEENLKGMDCVLLVKDALTLPVCSYVAADLPYAKNTHNQELDVLYKRFALVLCEKLRKRAVLGFPSVIDVSKVFKGTKKALRIVHVFNYYLHKSLSKQIVVVENI
jgi:tRNA (guanine10-N2)-dimethyltransferase